MKEAGFPVLETGAVVAAAAAALVPSFPYEGRICLTVLAAALAASDIVFRMRRDVQRENSLKAVGQHIQEAQRQGEENAARIREEAEDAQKKTKEKLAAFYSKASHSLRIPISVIQGYADLLESGLIQDENVRREYLNKIRERTEYMNNALSQLLTEARLQADFSICLWEHFDLIELLQKAIADMQDAAQKLGIRIELSSEYLRLPFEGDRTRLMRSFYNILENSLKYMKAAGRITVTVSVADNQALLVFKDTGAGMDREEAEHIFELNYRGSNSTQGNGMGLYLVYVTAIAHHGSVTARSSPGNGMTILLLLPLSQEKTGVSPAENANEEAAATEPQQDVSHDKKGDGGGASFIRK